MLTKHGKVAGLILLVFATILFPLLQATKASALGQVQVEWINAATVKATTIRFTEADRGEINNDLDDLSMDQINGYISNQVIGEFKDTNIGDGTREWVKDNGGCVSNITGSGPDKLNSVHIIIPGRGCKDVIDGKDIALSSGNITNPLLPASGNLQGNYAQIYFRWVNQNTLVRVDGREGEFVAYDPLQPGRYFRAEEDGEDDQDFVIYFDDYHGNYNVDGNFRSVGFENVQARTNPPSTGGPGTGGSSTNAPGDENPTCETSGFTLNWILCPVFNGVADLTDWLFENLVEPLLYVSPISTDSSDPSYQIWSGFRVFGNILLLIALLVLVFGQAIGGGLIDAYTAKKMMPRLLTAAILINLSVYIVALMVDVVNVAAAGLGQLMITPVRNAAQFTFTPTGIQSGFIVGGTGAGLIATYLTGVLFTGFFIKAAAFLGLFVLLPAILALIGAFVTMVIRQGLILFLIVVSPVAFALYALPNTEKYFKKWWELLFKTLLVYPIVVAIFAIADIMTVMIQRANGIGDGPLLSQTVQGSAHILAAIIAFVVQFLPLVLIPFAFKFAGGLIGTLYTTLSGYGKSTSEAIKGNVNDPNSLRNRTKRGVLEQAARGQQKVAHEGRRLNAGRGTRLRGRFADMFGNVDQRVANFNKAATERREALSSTGLDDLVYAGAGWEDVDPNGNTVYYDSKGRQISANTYRKGKSLYGGSLHDVQAGLAYTLSKAQTDEDVANFRTSFAKNAVSNNWSQDEAMGVWAGATYPHKGSFASEWYSTPVVSTGANGRTSGISFQDVDQNSSSYGKMIGDLHKTRQAFQLGSVRGVDWRAMGQRVDNIQQRIAAGSATDDDLRQFAQTNDVIDSMVHQGIVTRDGEGNISVSGASPEAQKAIEAIFKNRETSRFGTSQVQTASGVSLDERAVYDAAAVRADKAAHTAGIAAGTIARNVSFDENASIISHTIQNIDVTGDQGRTQIPRRVA